MPPFISSHHCQDGRLRKGNDRMILENGTHPVALDPFLSGPLSFQFLDI